MTRVTHYVGRAYYTSTGSAHEKEYPFTQEQANEVGAVLEAEGLNYEAARLLCERWTKRGNHTSIRYSYSLRTEDWLRNHDSKRKPT